MKDGFLILFVLFCTACNSGNKPAITSPNRLPASLVSNPATPEGMDAAAKNSKPTMDFTDTMHNFGAMNQGDVMEYDFAFTNNGKGTLIITDAVGSCGCTIPEYPHQPIEAGKNGIIKVKFNSKNKPGHQEKTVTLHSNALGGTRMLYIKADVNTP